MLDLILFFTHVVATFMMLGIMWFIQIDYYPMLGYVGKKAHVAYQREHNRRTTPWAIFLMSVELISGIGLVWFRPGIPLFFVLVNLVLLLLLWYSTWFVQVPFHWKLEKGFDATVHRKLVRSNWFRTIGWSVRGVLMLVLLSQFNNIFILSLS